MIVRIDAKALVSSASFWAAVSTVIPGAERNRSGEVETWKMSSYLVSAQNGSKPDGSQRWTGDSARSRVHSSCGGPWAAYP
jgi:hypothetical protein